MVPRLGLEVSPALVSFAELLMLPYPAMQAVIEEELSSNPALERLDAGECPICRGTWPSRCPICSTPRDRAGAADRGTAAARPTDVAAAESESQTLVAAVRMEGERVDMAVVEYLVGSFDGHGMLDRSCAHVAAELRVDESVVAHALAAIRRAGPPGIGATSVEECLLFQLEALHLDDDDVAAISRQVIASHLPDLARGHFSSIATQLGVSPADVKQVLELIRRRLRPHPDFEGGGRAIVSYVVPDVIIRHDDETNGALVVDLVEPSVTRLGVRRLASRDDAGCAPPAAGDASVSRATSFVTMLRDRWDTLRRVVECAVGRQQDFLDAVPAGLEPLTRAEVAAELGLHESTVSRAVADKYALLPDRTVVALSSFFGGRGGVDRELLKLVESADGPVSDQYLADQLRDAGYSIARRTVAKHRARLGISSTAMR
jgi:RNA polymerase sigma-54 factor